MGVGMSVPFIYDIIKMTVIINLNVVNMLLLKRVTVHIWVLIYSIIKMRDFLCDCPFYVIFKIRDGIFLCVLYMILFSECWYMSECCIYDIIKMRRGMSVNVICMILKWWCLMSDCYLYNIIYKKGVTCVNAVYITKTRGGIWLNVVYSYMILLKWEILYIWLLYIWYC